MTRSLSQTCYSCLMLTSKMVLIVTSASMVFTLTASAVFNDEQLDALANVIHYITKLVFYLTISIGSFILGKVSSQVRHQKEQEKHAAVLQAATRRRLSQRSPTVYKAAQATAAQATAAQATAAQATAAQATAAQATAAQATAAQATAAQATAAQGPTTPPATLSLDTSYDSPPKMRSSHRARGRAARLEFESPRAPVPTARRLSMDDADVQW